MAPAEPSDVRLWYLPRVQGLLGFNSFHRGDLARARALTVEAMETSRALRDRTGVRVQRGEFGEGGEGRGGAGAAGGWSVRRVGGGDRSRTLLR